jgi:hypothetical protein
MQKFNSKTLFIAASALISVLFAASYFSFSQYKPKALQEVREVRGYKTQETNILDIPTPRYAEGLAYDQTLNSKKYTFRTDRSPEEIQKFYSNILDKDNWRLKKEGSTDDFYTTEYRKDNFTVLVWAAYDEDVKLTFASVEILKFED